MKVDRLRSELRRYFIEADLRQDDGMPYFPTGGFVTVASRTKFIVATMMFGYSFIAALVSYSMVVVPFDRSITLNDKLIIEIISLIVLLHSLVQIWSGVSYFRWREKLVKRFK